MGFKYAVRNWVEYRQLPDLVEQDFHWVGDDSAGSYHENMQTVLAVALNGLIAAQAAGKKYVLFTHGGSTSRPGMTTSRSQVRKLMGSKEATPYIIRRECIHQSTVFVAAIRPLKTDGKKFGTAPSIEQDLLLALARAEQAPPKVRLQSLVAAWARRQMESNPCQSCGAAVNYYVAKLCRNNTAQYGGNIYCLDCQQKM